MRGVAYRLTSLKALNRSRTNSRNSRTVCYVLLSCRPTIDLTAGALYLDITAIGPHDTTNVWHRRPLSEMHETNYFHI